MRRFHVIALYLLATPAAFAQCEPEWSTAFQGNGIAGGDVRAMAVFDGELFLGGEFSFVGNGPQEFIARWDGAQWIDPGDVPEAVRGLATLHDNGEDELYLATTARMHRWNGSGWPVVSFGEFPDGAPIVMETFQEAGLVIIGGSFDTVGNTTAHNIIAYDGSSFSPLGEGTNSTVYDVTVWEQNGIPTLYVVGQFTEAGGLPASGLASWNTVSWSAVPGEANGSVRGCTTFDFGEGDELVIVGDFTEVGGVMANGVARFNGSRWAPVGSGLPDAQGLDVGVVDFGQGPRLVAGGTWNDPARLWNGFAWISFGINVSGQRARTFGTYDAGDGPEAIIAGDVSGGSHFFNGAATGVQSEGAVRWDGTLFQPLGSGVDGTVHALLPRKENGQPVLYVAGSFSSAGGTAQRGASRWDGQTFEPLGAGVDGQIFALAEFEGLIIAAGDFETVLGEPFNNIAAWDGDTWLPLGDGLDDEVNDLFVDDSTGSSLLYAVGEFDESGNTPVKRVGVWDGGVWQEVGGGMAGEPFSVRVWDDGTGPALYVGGTIGVNDPDDDPIVHIARWDGEAWGTVGGSGNGGGSGVHTMIVTDMFGDEMLVVGGSFDEMGGIEAASVAAWDGDAWQPFGLGIPEGGVAQLVIFNDGDGRRLHAAGSFGDRVAYWNNIFWDEVGEITTGGVNALVAHDLGDGEHLYAGGPSFFTLDGDPVDSGLVIYEGCKCPGDFNDDGVRSILDFVVFQEAFLFGLDSADVNCDGILNILDFVEFQLLFQAGCP